MGLRPKILLTFVVCFGLMTGLSLVLLQRSMTESYEAIERKELIGHVRRVQHALGTRLEALSGLTQDWSIWTAMYQFARNPDPAWIDENMSLDASTTGDLSLALVLGRDGRVLALRTRGPEGGRLSLDNWLRGPYKALFEAESTPHGCGLMPTDAGRMLVCSARIRRSDATGDFVGNLVMGHLLDDTLLRKMSEQVHMDFELLAPAAVPAGLTRWPDAAAPSPLGPRDFLTAVDERRYRVFYPLRDLRGSDSAIIAFDVAREVHAQGQRLLREVRLEQVVITLAMAGLLFAVVHVLVVARLRRLERQLVAVADQGDWSARIGVGGRDELGAVATRVNRLLELIETQVSELNALSLTDALTGLANRRGFEVTLERECPRSARSGKPLALLALDVDRFKRYNDHYGHPAGDRALKAVAEVLHGVSRSQPDLAARTGGEEFMLLLPETDLHGARAVAQRVQATLGALQLAHAASDIHANLTVSIGIALLRDEPVAALLARVDRALYQAKAAGRNRIYMAE